MQKFPVARRHLQEALKVFLRRGSAPNAQKIDDLYEKLGFAVTGAAHAFGQALEAGEISVMADAQQGSARDIAHARGLDNQCRGAAARKALVPSEHRRRDIAVFGRAPRNHGRNPGARRQSDRTQRDRLEQLRLLGLNRGGPGRIQRRVLDTLRRTPRRHGLRRRESQPLPRSPPMRSLRPAPVLPQPTWRGSSCP